MENNKQNHIERRIPLAKRLPYDAENKHLSYAAAVAKERARKEREAKLKAYETELKGEAATQEAPIESSVEAPKKMGRPKKIE